MAKTKSIAATSQINLVSSMQVSHDRGKRVKVIRARGEKDLEDKLNSIAYEYQLLVVVVNSNEYVAITKRI